MGRMVLTGKLFLALAAAACVCGCAAVGPVASTVAGPLSPQPAQALTQTSVELYENNFVIVKTNVVGVSRGFSLLGVIPIVSAPVVKATGRLYAEAGIQAGQPESLAHVMIEHSSLYLILFSIPKTTVRADIIRFNQSVEPENQPPPAPAMRPPKLPKRG